MMMTSESQAEIRHNVECDLKIPNDIVDINEAWIIDLIIQMGQLKDCQQVKRILDLEIDQSKWQEVGVGNKYTVQLTYESNTYMTQNLRNRDILQCKKIFDLPSRIL